MKRLITVAVWLAWFAAMGSLAVRADETRRDELPRDEVRAKLAADGWTVVWGRTFTEADWFEGSEAILQSIATHQAAPFLQCFDASLSKSLAEIEQRLSGSGVERRQLEASILNSLQTRSAIVLGTLELEAAVAHLTPPAAAGAGGAAQPKAIPREHQFYIRYRSRGGAAATPVATSNGNERAWVHKDGIITSAGEGRWVEKIGETTYTFEQVGKPQAEFIELHDKSRDLYVRLYTHEMQAKGMGKLPNYVHVLDGSWKVWKFDKGVYHRQADGSWVEQSGGTEYKFKQSAATAEYIELFDAARQVTLRLYADRMMLKGLNNKFPDFVKFYDGGWVR